MATKKNAATAITLWNVPVAMKSTDTKPLSSSETVGVPPSLTRVATAGPKQKQKSWYMLAFQHVGLAEEMVMHDNFKFFEQWGEGGSNKQWEADLSRPGRMTSTLNIYRAGFQEFEKLQNNGS